MVLDNMICFCCWRFSNKPEVNINLTCCITMANWPPKGSIFPSKMEPNRLINRIVKWLKGGCADHGGIIRRYWWLHPHHFRHRLIRCHQESARYHLIHLKRKVQGELSFHYCQCNPGRKTNTQFSHVVLIPLFYKQNPTGWPFYEPKKFQIRTRKGTMIVPAHQCETTLVLTAIPELNTCTIKPMEMVVPGHPVASTASIGKLRLTSWVHHKPCREHLKINDELHSS